MSAYAGWDAVGADGQSYPEVAARAVQSIHAQQQFPYYGYLRSGVNQKIYLFTLLDDARNWFGQAQHQPDHEYIAVFSKGNLRAPIAGMEHFQSATVAGCVPQVGCVSPQVGNVWPFLLGLPLGGLGGYFLRRWQEPEAARSQVVPLRDVVRPLLPGQPPVTPGPKTAGDPYIGGPWLDVVGQYGDYSDQDYGQDYVGQWYDMVGPQVGGPWLDVVGPQVGGPWLDFADPQVGGPWLDVVGAQASQSPQEGARPPVNNPAQARALIRAATQEVVNSTSMLPSATHWVWWLAAPMGNVYGAQGGAPVAMEAGPQSEPYSSLAEAMARVRDLGQQPGVIARSVFDRTSRHWPNPVTWSMSNQPEHDQLIANFVASQASPRTAGVYAGASWDTMIGAAVDDVKARALSEARKRAGDVVGVIHLTKPAPAGLWVAMAFNSMDDAFDWFDTATQDQNAFTYAAYYDKTDPAYSTRGVLDRPYIEKIGGYHQSKSEQRFPRSGIVGSDW